MTEIDDDVPSVSVTLLMPVRVLDRLDRYRRELPYPPSRSAVIRRFVETGLASSGSKKRVPVID